MPLEPLPETERSKMLEPSSGSMPPPSSETSTTVEWSLRRTLTVVRPAPWARAFSIRVAITWVSGPLDPQTAALRGTCTRSSRWARR